MNKRTCEKCSKLFDHSGRGKPTRCPECRHGRPTDYKRGCRCTECTAAKTSEVNSYTRKRKAEGRPIRKTGPRPKSFEGECRYCASTFTAEQEQPYCSHSCHMRYRYRGMAADEYRVHQKVIPYHPKPAPATPVTVVTSPKWWGVITNGPCAWCGETFTATSGAARFCSDRCSRGHHKSKRGFHPSPILRRAIYERDGWTCQLCFEPVETSDPGEYNPWAPSLDHIVPQSHMLVPDHSPENLRTAHVWCNAVRGDGTYHADFFEEATWAICLPSTTGLSSRG